ncbi:MAG: acetolactate synthase [Thermodesulfovibrionales bacterium]|nr:acetolactate synthase [Thermodesulfovibrionales bacterium]
MKVKQLSVFIENKQGHLLDVLTVLANAKINIRALSIADTSEFGILRLIVADPDKAKKALTKAKFTAKENEVIAVAVPDEPGGLAKVLEIFATEGLNLEYLYAFVRRANEKAIVVLKTENLTVAIKALKKAGVQMLSDKEICKL